MQVGALPNISQEHRRHNRFSGMGFWVDHKRGLGFISLTYLVIFRVLKSHSRIPVSEAQAMVCPSNWRRGCRWSCDSKGLNVAKHFSLSELRDQILTKQSKKNSKSSCFNFILTTPPRLSSRCKRDRGKPSEILTGKPVYKDSTILTS